MVGWRADAARESKEDGGAGSNMRRNEREAASEVSLTCDCISGHVRGAQILRWGSEHAATRGAGGTGGHVSGARPALSERGAGTGHVRLT
ncbi:hypothetical protein FGB62_72g023 [Gracilaria domingensis]|nr:hypothetical protein FGB62_72g023 [Gracilaria domingensis]